MTTPDISIPEEIASHPAWTRLTSGLTYYSSRSRHCKKYYHGFRLCQIVLSVFIPIASHMSPETAKWATSIAGALIAILEGAQHLKQYATLWVTYRSTSEHLKHEKYLFLSSAGPYKDVEMKDKLVLLSERVESKISTEHARWVNETDKASKKEAQNKVRTPSQ